MTVPTTLDEALAALGTLISPEEQKWMRSVRSSIFHGGTHHFLGRYLRNEWGLWEGSALARWFNAQGIYHADDMSGIILESFWRRLNGQEIGLAGQVEECQAYWREQGLLNKEGN